MNRRLYRSPSDRVVAGVAGGMAETYDMDPAVVRIAWALLVLLTGGLLLILYVVIAIVVPLRPEFEPTGYPPSMGEPDAPTQTGMSALTGEPGAGAGQANGPPGGLPGAAPAPPGTYPPPVAPTDAWRARAAQGSSNNNESAGSIVLGAILIVVGGFFLLRQFIPSFNPALFWPVLVIIGGVLLIAVAVGRRR